MLTFDHSLGQESSQNCLCQSNKSFQKGAKVNCQVLRHFSALIFSLCAHRRGSPDPLRLHPLSPGALQFKGSKTFLPRRSKGRARALQVDSRRRERHCGSMSSYLYWMLWVFFFFFSLWRTERWETFCSWGKRLKCKKKKPFTGTIQKHKSCSLARHHSHEVWQ